MNKTENPGGATHTENALTWLNLQLDRELEVLDEDDVFNAPPDQIEAILGRHGVTTGSIDRDRDRDTGPATRAQDAATMPLEWAEHERSSWIVRRPAFREKVVASLRANTVTMISGPIGRGRSTFWRQELAPSDDLAKYWPRVHIDCCALRMQCIRKLESEAVRALFRDREQECNRYLDGLGERKDNPLLAYLADKLYVNSGLIVLDHAECLALRDSGEIVGWMRDLTRWCAERGVKLLVLWGGAVVPSTRKAFAEPSFSGDGRTASQWIYTDPSRLNMPLLSATEIADWWAQPRFAAYRDAGIDGAGIHAVTGGVARIVRDFGRYVEDRQRAGGPAGRTMLDDFTAISTGTYAPEIERALAVVGREPRLLDHPELAHRYRLHDLMMASGAFAELAPGKATFSSPILERRFAVFRGGRGRRAMIQRGNVFDIVRNHAYQEVCGTNLNDRLLSLPPPVVFRKLETIFRTLCNDAGYETKRAIKRFSARDAMHAKLWSDGPWREGENRITYPLCASDDPDIALALQSGRIFTANDGKLVLPVVGRRGLVNAVMMLDLGTPPADASRLDRRLLVRSLWRLCLAVQPAIANALDRFAMNNAYLMHRRSTYRDSQSNSMKHVLRSLGCKASVVMRRSYHGWINVSQVSDFPPDDAKRPFDVGQLEINNPERLDMIGTHEGGVVLVQRDLETIFGGIEWTKDMCVFVVRGCTTNRLHLYVFCGDEAKRLDGFKQVELKRFSHQAELQVAQS